ncbi:4'-phosphopantetheinyl transferase family protein [Castellaniella defragrans]|uniref:4'-phosphopantetheinyl transferase n=2 Tax=Castellaniella defragrans TaxID=75697 RepID=A0A7W9TQB1_CASDE|nr:hypothetical protein [Castellaniella defragrans]MBB6084058.1 4'-phosphopantetheinyl transferase [Castellaniella defragrans]
MHAPDARAPYRLILSRGLPDAAGAARLRLDLPEDEWRRIARLRRADDRLRSLVGRALARRLLGRRLGLAPADVPLGAGPHGKPMLVAAAWHFNIAHSGDLVLVGVGPGPLGVDVEHCPDQVDAALWRLVTGGPLPAASHPALDPPARDHPAAGRSGAAPDPRAFCAQWVRREAILKACGLGLSVEPGALRLADAGGSDAPAEPVKPGESREPGQSAGPGGPGETAGWTPVSGLPEAEGLWVRLLWSEPGHCAALCLPGGAPGPDTASCAGGRPAPGAPPPDAWTLRTLALADWIGAPDDGWNDDRDG